MKKRLRKEVDVTMKLLFFDLEFANSQIPGSVYSLGYLITDESFQILMPPTDLCIAPECIWNEYVEKNILAYPKQEVESSPPFPEQFDFIQKLFGYADLAIGFAVGNDVKALLRDCERYGLPPLSYRWFDVERLCAKQEEHQDAHGLGGCYSAWCGEEADHRHRSDGDAYATMRLMEAICKAKHVTADMMIQAYPECGGETSSGNGGQSRTDTTTKQQQKKRRWYHRKNKQEKEQRT